MEERQSSLSLSSYQCLGLLKTDYMACIVTLSLLKKADKLLRSGNIKNLLMALSVSKAQCQLKQNLYSSFLNCNLFEFTAHTIKC